MRKVVARILVFCMLIMMLIVPVTTANGETVKENKSRVIYVVFDNSGSMYGAGNKAWSQATYAMEVFAAMMNYESGDVMKIFPMHNVLTKGEQGEISSMTIASQADIEKIHNMYTPKPLGTPYTQVNNAYRELAKLLDEEKADEGWLVVLTDGDFDADIPQAGLREDLKAKAQSKENLFVQYLAVGEEVKHIPEGDESVGFYAQKAGNSSEVVNELAVISNLIFKRNEYAGYTTENGLDFDIPISKLIVFAQGANVSIGELKNAEGGSVNLQNSCKVSCSATEGSGKTSYVKETPQKDTTLKGEVAIFASSSSMVPGKYSLDVTGADSIQIYYEPDVKFSVGLFDGDKLITDSTIEGGAYTVKVGFVELLSGSFIDGSKLLGQPQYTLTINGEQYENASNDGKVQEVDVEVKGDILELVADVTYLNNYADHASVSFSVCTLEMQVEAPVSMKLKSLEDSANALLVSATKNGQPLSEEQWNTAIVEIKALNEENENYDIEWNVEKGKEVSTWIISPKYKNGDLFKTGIGKMKITVGVSADIDGTTYGSAEKVSTNIEDDKTIIDFAKRYWKEITISLAALILILGYIPPIKKYLPRSISERPNIICRAKQFGVNNKNEKGKFSRKLVTTLIPYMPEEGALEFSPFPARNEAKVRANGGQFMLILNPEVFAGKKNIKINGENVPKEQKKPIRVSASTDFVVDTETYKYTCTPKIKYSANGGKKKKYK